MKKMEIKTKKIFSLAVLVLCIAVFGLASAASANGEPSIESVLNSTYGVGAWEEVLYTDEYTFTGLNTATVILVEKQSGYNNPTGWYEAAAPDNKQVLFDNPRLQVGQFRTIDTAKEFGLYIGSDDGYFYSEKSENFEGKKHVRLFTLDKGGYVLAFEDLKNLGDQDYNDIVIELTGVNLIPEFATIAIPVASILGLLFFFNHRKRRKN